MKLEGYKDSLKVQYLVKIIFLIIIPFIVLVSILMWHEVKIIESRSIENIEKVQETIISQLSSDINTSALKLSHMVYASNSEVLKIASQTTSSNDEIRHAKENELNSLINLMLEPQENIVSIIFYMNNGDNIYLKSDITKNRNELYALDSVRKALIDPTNVHISLYETEKNSDFYSNSTKDSLIAIITIAPSTQIDMTGKINTIMLIIKVSAWDTIKNYNRGYLNGTNKFGYMYIEKSDGEQIFSTGNYIDINPKLYTCIETTFEIDNQEYSIKNYVKPHDLSLNVYRIAIFFIIAALIFIFLLLYMSRNFLHRVILPIEDISKALRSVEDGNLDVHVSPYGHLEVKIMIEQFNAMVRRLKAQKNEYEQNLKKFTKFPKEYFAFLINKDYTTKKVAEEIPEFFNKSYVLMEFVVYSSDDSIANSSQKIKNIFERNARFASRCYMANKDANTIFVMYKVNENNYQLQLVQMINELMKTVFQQCLVNMAVIYSPPVLGESKFNDTLELIIKNKALCLLKGKGPIVDLASNDINYLSIINGSSKYEEFAKALYLLNEVMISTEKNKCFILLSESNINQVRYVIYSVIFAIVKQFNNNGQNFDAFFETPINYIEFLNNISDTKTIKIWFDNFINQLIDKYKKKINTSLMDVIPYSQLYMERNFYNPNLSLPIVASQVDLSVKYFTTLFSKETGITFSKYLRKIRISHAIQLLETTNKKVYEIGLLVGYNSPENFTRMFSKETGLSPSKYRSNLHSKNNKEEVNID